MKILPLIVLWIFLNPFVACLQETRLNSSSNYADAYHQETVQYLFLSHTRSYGDDEIGIDRRLDSLNFLPYDMLLLGGDIIKDKINRSTLGYIDNLFDLKKKSTLWALGNHDYFDIVLINEFTLKPRFHTYFRNQTTFVVLDTQDNLSNILGLQLDMLKHVTDTIQESKNLILLHHKLFWMYGNEELEHLVSTTSNARIGDCFYCINPNNFYPDIYPLLNKVIDRGIRVLCIGGDIGVRSRQFEYTTEEGIVFLASGIREGDDESKVLILSYIVSSDELNWSFVPLKNLF